MNGWTRAFFTKMDNLKFLTWVGEDGFPWIVPVIQAQADGGGQIALSTSVYGAELARIPTGATVAVLGLALTMEDVLVRGTYLGAQRQAGVQAARVAVDWVYNPMPPAPCQIYPAQDLKPVTQF